MAYKIITGALGPTRKLTTSVPTRASRPLDLSTGKFATDRRTTKTKSAGRRSRPAKPKLTGDPALNGKPWVLS